MDRSRASEAIATNTPISTKPRKANMTVTTAGDGRGHPLLRANSDFVVYSRRSENLPPRCHDDHF